MALPIEAHKKTLQMLQLMARECVETKLVPDILQYATLKASLEDLDGTPVINLSQVPLQGWNSLVNRGMDVAIALAASLAPPPLPPLGRLGYLVRGPGADLLPPGAHGVGRQELHDPEVPLHADRRRGELGPGLGSQGRSSPDPGWGASSGAGRSTSCRRSGTSSSATCRSSAPRPERPTFVREFKHKIPQYMLRHRVKAGITGWAQVHGWRGNTSIKKRIQYDLYYIEKLVAGLRLQDPVDDVPARDAVERVLRRPLHPNAQAIQTTLHRPGRHWHRSRARRQHPHGGRGGRRSADDRGADREEPGLCRPWRAGPRHRLRQQPGGLAEARPPPRRHSAPRRRRVGQASHGLSHRRRASGRACHSVEDLGRP